MRVLLIEDDPMIGKAVRQGLRSAGFVVDWVVDGGSAETFAVTPCQRARRARPRPAVARRHAGAAQAARAAPHCLMAELGCIVRNTCRTPAAGPDAPTFDIVTTPNPTQRHAPDLIKQIRP